MMSSGMLTCGMGAGSSIGPFMALDFLAFFCSGGTGRPPRPLWNLVTSVASSGDDVSLVTGTAGSSVGAWACVVAWASTGHGALLWGSVKLLLSEEESDSEEDSPLPEDAADSEVRELPELPEDAPSDAELPWVEVSMGSTLRYSDFGVGGSSAGQAVDGGRGGWVGTSGSYVLSSTVS